MKLTLTKSSMVLTGRDIPPILSKGDEISLKSSTKRNKSVLIECKILERVFHRDNFLLVEVGVNFKWKHDITTCCQFGKLCTNIIIKMLGFYKIYSPPEAPWAWAWRDVHQTHVSNWILIWLVWKLSLEKVPKSTTSTSLTSIFFFYVSPFVRGIHASDISWSNLHFPWVVRLAHSSSFW